MQDSPDQFPASKGHQCSPCNQIQACSVLGSVAHVKQQSMADGEQTDHHKTRGQEPSEQKESATFQWARAQQQKQK